MTARKSSKRASNQAKVETPTAEVKTKIEAPAGYKAKRAVTLPAIVLKTEGETRCLRIDEPMHVSAALKGERSVKDDDGKKRVMEPATVCAATDIETGEVGNFVVPAVVKGNLDEKYPDNSYVGCVFQITNNGKRPGKRYHDFIVIELEAE